jgi:uncharacterized protein YodC (DUF2158 family)
MLNREDSRERQAIIAALLRLCDPRRMENLIIGDTVQLKSGGPIMTLGNEMAAGGWKCQWFSGTELKEGLFRLEQLKKVEPREADESQGSQGWKTY